MWVNYDSRDELSEVSRRVERLVLTSAPGIAMNARDFLLAIVALTVLGPGLVACSDDPVTYHGEVRSIVDENCSGCHYPGEGAPLNFHTYEDVRDQADLALAFMESGDMPPWTPDPDCREYKDQRVMSDEDIEVFRRWIEDGKKEGTKPDDYEEFSVPEHSEADLRLEIPDAPYEPREDLTDEYRCFPLGENMEEDVFATGVHVDTGGKEVIHHANIFLASPHVTDEVDALEASSDGPGYPCFGDAGFNSIDLVGSWVPGIQPIYAPEDSAIIIPEGARLVMQVHFNTLFADPEPVSPAVMLYTRDDPPDYQVRGMPFAIMDFVIPPGESESRHTREFRNRSGDTWKVLGVAPHLHMLGSRATVTVDHGDSESCLVDIPDWDFDWQQEYRFLDDEWVEVETGDTVRLSCEFDNSPDNQPIIDGEQIEPQEVSWGARSTDEMCINFLVVQQPYDDSGGGELCEDFGECRDACDDRFAVGCLFDCGAEDIDCGLCLFNEVQACANQYCPEELDDAWDCLFNCAQEAQGGGGMEACLEDTCPEESSALEDCLRPPIEGGLCDHSLEQCNVEP